MCMHGCMAMCMHMAMHPANVTIIRETPDQNLKYYNSIHTKFSTINNTGSFSIKVDLHSIITITLSNNQSLILSPEKYVHTLASIENRVARLFSVEKVMIKTKYSRFHISWKNCLRSLKSAGHQQFCTDTSRFCYEFFKNKNVPETYKDIS